jgi:hypothetical protein
MISTILSNAWRVYREHFGLIAAVVIVVWLPCELLNSYVDAFVFGPDDFRRSFKLTQFLDNFIGIIATAGVTFIAITAHTETPASFGSAVGTGFSSWGRMWWTRFLSGLAIIVALLLLIIPGVYLLTRLCFVESVVVAERISGTRAMARSFELTNDRFWQTFRFGLAVGILTAIPLILIALPTLLVPAFDHWLIDAFVQLTCDVIGAFATVAFLCGYQAYAERDEVR